MKLLLVNEPIKDILVNELQLGEQLNECIHEDRRSHFSLVLAMLTEDVRDHAQFMLPQTEDAKKDSNEQSLRKLFNVSSPTPLGLTSLDEIKQYNQADLIEQHNLTELRLLNAIAPKPLAFRDDVKHINMDVINNTSIHCQKRLREQKQEISTLANRLSFKAEEWLNVVNESMVNAKVAVTV